MTVGDNFHSGPGCALLTRLHDYGSGSAISYVPEYKRFDIRIGDNVWFGMNVLIAEA